MSYPVARWQLTQRRRRQRGVQDGCGAHAVASAGQRVHRHPLCDHVAKAHGAARERDRLSDLIGCRSLPQLASTLSERAVFIRAEFHRERFASHSLELPCRSTIRRYEARAEQVMTGLVSVLVPATAVRYSVRHTVP